MGKKISPKFPEIRKEKKETANRGKTIAEFEDEEAVLPKGRGGINKYAAPEESSEEEAVFDLALEDDDYSEQVDFFHFLEFLIVYGII